MSDVTSDYEKIEKRTRIRGNIRNGIVYLFLCLWALIVLFPFYWMVLTSVKSYGSYNAEYIPKFSPCLPLCRTTWTLLPLFLWEDTCGTPCFSPWSPLPSCWWSSPWQPSLLQG